MVCKVLLVSDPIYIYALSQTVPFLYWTLSFLPLSKPNCRKFTSHI